jgi:sec-independent protein translocase protein TatB
MFDVGWSELLLIAAIAVLAIGPKELPVVMRTLGRVMRRLQYARYVFSKQFEDFMEAQDLDDIRNSVNFEAKKIPHDVAEDEPEERADEDRAPVLGKGEGKDGSEGA